MKNKNRVCTSLMSLKGNIWCDHLWSSAQPELCFGFWLPFLLFCVRIIPQCFNNVDIWALGRPILVFHSVFSILVCFYCTDIVFGIVVVLKNEATANQDAVHKNGTTEFLANCPLPVLSLGFVMNSTKNCLWQACSNKVPKDLKLVLW